MSFSKLDLTRVGIPDDILIETLYQATVRRKEVLAALPRRSMLRTLRNKYPDIKTIGDLFDYAPNTKAFQEFKAGVLTTASEICAINKAIGEIKTIPSSAFGTLEECLRAFLPAYREAKMERADFLNLAVASTKLQCDALQKLFDEHSKDNSRKRVAHELKTTHQNVDYIIEATREDFNKLFFQNETPDNIAVSPSLVKMVRDVRDSFGLTGSKTELVRLSGIKSPRMLELLALIMGVTIQESGTVVPRSGTDTTLGVVKGSQINRNKGRVKSILKKEGIPISFDDFRILLKEEFKDEGLRKGLEEYARSSEEFEIFYDKSGIERIAVKWEHLKDLTTEIIRILYDNDAWGVKYAMSPKDIRAQWEYRAKLFGKKTKFLSHYNEHWRLCSSRNGFVMLRWSEGDEGFLDGQTYVSRLKYYHPAWTFDDVFKQATEEGYDRIFASGSLKTYYTNIDKDTTTEQALIAIVNMLDYAPDKTLPLQETLTRVNEKGIGIKYAALRKWIINNDKKFSYYSIPGKRTAFVKLLDKKAPLVLPYSSKSASSPDLKTSSEPAVPVVTKPVTSATQIDWKGTTASIFRFVPETKIDISLKSCSDRAFDIMKDGDTAFADNNVFISWLRNIANYAEMTSWDKDGVRVNVLRSMETYISNFYRMKTGCDLRTDILNDVTFYKNEDAVGLGTKIKYLRYHSLLPSFNSQYKSGPLGEAVFKASNLVLKARNDNSGHPDTLVDMSEMDNQIHAAMLLILYLASRL